MGKKVSFSAVVVGKNEAKHLSDCLNSLKWTDEIIFVNNNSTDESLEIVKHSGAKIFNFDAGNFSSRKNYAFGKASCDWILSIDADERVTQELKVEIQSKIANSLFAAYAIPRKNIILGKELKHGWWPDYVIRLFKKEKFLKYVGSLHEQPEFDGKLGYLNNSLLHLKHDNLEDMVLKTNDWSEVEAELMKKANHPSMNILRFATSIFRELRLRLIYQRAFLDGSVGVIYALYQAYSRFLSYAKLWEMQLKNKPLN